MPRDVDKRKTRKALRKLKKVAERAKAEEGQPLTDWEREFVDGVTDRLETYGSAFNDPEKGAMDDALSARQTHIARVLDKKTRQKKADEKRAKKAKADAGQSGMAKSGFQSSFKRKAPVSKSRVRDINDDLQEVTEPTPNLPPSKPAGEPGLRVVSDVSGSKGASGSGDEKPEQKPLKRSGPSLRVISGGRGKD